MVINRHRFVCPSSKRFDAANLSIIPKPRVGDIARQERNTNDLAFQVHAIGQRKGILDVKLHRVQLAIEFVVRSGVSGKDMSARDRIVVVDRVDRCMIEIKTTQYAVLTIFPNACSLGRPYAAFAQHGAQIVQIRCNGFSAIGRA